MGRDYCRSTKEIEQRKRTSVQGMFALKNYVLHKVLDSAIESKV